MSSVCGRSAWMWWLHYETDPCTNQVIDICFQYLIGDHRIFACFVQKTPFAIRRACGRYPPAKRHCGSPPSLFVKVFSLQTTIPLVLTRNPSSPRGGYLTNAFWRPLNKRNIACPPVDGCLMVDVFVIEPSPVACLEKRQDSKMGGGKKMCVFVSAHHHKRKSKKQKFSKMSLNIMQN